MTSKSQMKRVSIMAHGRLKDHKSKCNECDGTGSFYGCECCNGDGEFHWPSWNGQNYGKCILCPADGVPVHEDEDVPGDKVCLKCFVLEHKEYCGCDLWKDVEEEVLNK